MGRSKVNKYEISKSGDQLKRIQSMLATLEMYSMDNSLEKIEEVARKNKDTYFDFLESILEKEFANREQARIARWMRNAKFPSEKSIDSYDFSQQPGLDERNVRELASCRFVSRGQNIVFFGPPGVGKTHLSIAIGKEAILQGIEVKFITLELLVEHISRLDGPGLNRLLRSLSNPPLLIIDDIDYDEPDKIVSSFLFKLIFRRDEKNVSTIYSSNKPFKEWGPLFSGDKHKATAAIDRIHNNGSHIINISGDSYRFKSARRDSKTKTAS